MMKLFALVACLEIIRILIGCCIKRNMKSTFLNEELKEDISVEQLSGFIVVENIV